VEGGGIKSEQEGGWVPVVVVEAVVVVIELAVVVPVILPVVVAFNDVKVKLLVVALDDVLVVFVQLDSCCK
jgi:hypothetical protein